MPNWASTESCPWLFLHQVVERKETNEFLLTWLGTRLPQLVVPRCPLSPSSSWIPRLVAVLLPVPLTILAAGAPISATTILAVSIASAPATIATSTLLPSTLALPLVGASPLAALIALLGNTDGIPKIDRTFPRNGWQKGYKRGLCEAQCETWQNCTMYAGTHARTHR